jgi:hypothetical protein
MGDMNAKPLLLVCGALVAVAACGGSQPAARAASKPSPSASAAPAAAPAPTAAPAPAPVATCRKLPVVNNDPSKPAGFLDVTTGKFTPDASARLTSIGGDLVQTAGSPALVGWPSGWPAYSATGHWVPAPPAWVSPDGTRYLYPAYGEQTLHVVDVRTGADRVVFRGGRLLPVQWADDAVYVTDWPTGAQGPMLYDISLSDGHLRTVPVGRLPGSEPIHGGGAWQLSVDNGVPARTGQNGPMPNHLSRTDLQTGRSTDWLTLPGAYLQLIGFATDGSPLLLATSAASSQLVRVPAPGRAPETYGLPVFPTSVTDASGTWLSQPDGTILLYRPGAAPARAGRGDAGLEPVAGCAE